MSSSLQASCVASFFPTPTLFGAELYSLDATWTKNYSYVVDQGRYASSHAFSVEGLNFCNVSIWYIHPGYDDHINVQILLPERWNGRFQGTGGGGFVVGLSEPAIVGGMAQGYAVASSDGGHKTTVTEDWVLKSPGNINWPNVLNFGSVSLYDFTIIGKQVTTTYYGKPPEYSYFTGCSTGGRQALALAQRWPELYDGILSGAPGINYAELATWISYPQLMMNWLGEYPQLCETAAITRAAIEACDHLDGAVDGIISNSKDCGFDPRTIVNTTIFCEESGKVTQITAAAAKLALAAWAEARSINGTFLWHGLAKDAPLSSLANTTCDYQGSGECSGVPYAIAKDWIQYFIYKDPSFDFNNVTHEQYAKIFHMALQQYDSPLGTSDPDVRGVKENGGKILMWHGVADQLVPINGTRQYYDIATAIDPNITDYFRYFEAPGVNHCRGGVGPYPGDILTRLVDWVEKDLVPETLAAKSLPNDKGVSIERGLCPYPKVQNYKDGDITKDSSYECV
ncbi:Carboxylic ester hydrolase [Fusarium sp. Ph1]|nr:Carboxylic ester hydrolase [Fusarium sp. Ph1]